MKYQWILGVLVSLGCATTGSALHRQEGPGAWIALNTAPVHLGDQNYGGQSFNQARVESQSWCTVLRIPRAAAVAVRIEGLRNTERPTNHIRIDGTETMLPMLLAQGSAGLNSRGTQMSTMWESQMAAGPHEICVVAGRNDLHPTDIDDFEFSGLYFRAEGIEPSEIESRVIELRPEVRRASTEVAQRAPVDWAP